MSVSSDEGCPSPAHDEPGLDDDDNQPPDCDGDSVDERVTAGRADALRRNMERNNEKDLLRSPFPVVDTVPRNMLWFPDEYVNPLRMCGLSKKLVCLPDSAPKVEAMGCELVFVSMGELMSKHVQMVCHLFDMLNKRHDIDGCAVAVPNRTRLATQQRSGSKKKDPIVVGIQELFGSREEALHDFVNYEDWPEAERPMQSFAEFSRGVYMQDEETHVSTSNVRLRMNIVPIEYVVNGEKIRTVCIVIKVIPAEGLDLLKLIEDKYLANRHLNDRAGGEEIRNWCDVWQRVLDYETGVNLKFQGHRVIPDVMDVRTATGAGSALDILAPFLVFEKILNNLPGGYCGLDKRTDHAIEPGTLLIAGYPRVIAGNPWQLWCMHMRKMKEAYRKQLTQWRFIFISMLGGDQTQTLPRVLMDDGVRGSLEMEVSMRFSSDVVTTFDKMEPVTLPKLAIACIGAFMSLVAVEEEEVVRASPFRSDQSGAPARAGTRVQGTFVEYVRPYVEHDMQVATQCLLTDRYERSTGGADMPYAGRHILVHQSLRTTMRIVKDDPAVCSDTFLKYMSTRLTVSEREELMGVYHSDRVMAIAKILESLIKRNLCGCVANALHFTSGRMSKERRKVEQRILPFEEYMAFYDMQSAIMVYNESAKLNALNLSAFFALMVSDVLTFMGTHNSTWIFKQFTVWTICGNGHLRSKGMTCTMKRNSSGHGFVQQAFVVILQLMANIPGSTFSDLAPALKNYKLARITGPQIEGLAAVVVVAGKVQSKPDPGNFFKPITMDEFLRNVDLGALNTLITRIPRDSDGSNNTIKTCDPANHCMVRQAAVNSDIEGCGPFLCFIATNGNPDNIKISEPLKSFLVITAAGSS